LPYIPGMSESSAINYASPGVPTIGRPKSLLRVGGSLGIAALSINLLIFTVGCFGFNAVFKVLPLIPLLLSGIGMVLSIIGATLRKSSADEDTHVLSSMFVNGLAIAGSLLELSIWLGWGVFYQQGQQVG
jgi:hypothetical protein